MIAAVLLLACLDSPGPPPEPLHPRDYASPSGEWVLSIDPSERYGAGAGRYRMTRSGVLVWEREHPFTFQDAFVSDRGATHGYGYTSGSRAWARPGDELVIAMLESSRGDPAHVERIPLMQDLQSRGRHPWVRALVAYPALDRIRFELSVYGLYRESEWCVRSISDGRTVSRSAARPAYPESEEWSPPEPEGDRVLELQELACRTIGAVELEPPPNPSGVERELRFELLDRFGRIWLADWGSPGVHAFDRDGRWLLVARPAPEDLGRGLLSRAPRWMDVRPDGSVLVRIVEGLVEFTPHGRRVGRTGERSYRWNVQRHLSASGGRWEVDERRDAIVRIAVDESVLRTAERGANGRWLRFIRDIVPGPDGSLAVLESGYGASVAAAPSDYWIHVYDGAGEPLSSQGVPDPSFHLAFDGRRGALVSEGRILVVDSLGTEPLGVLAWEPPPDVHGLAFAPEGALLVFVGETVHRLLVP